MTRKMKAEPDYLSADLVQVNAVGIDRENRTILGFVVAKEGEFKSGRGRFDAESLAKIVELGNAATRGGLRSRFGHPTLSDDGLGKFLGRASNFRVEGNEVRADLKINATAMREPPAGGRPLGDYLMEMAETDPAAISSSLHLTVDIIDSEDDLAPLWMPTELIATDIVDRGDAVDELLSDSFLASLPTGTVYQATKLIDEQFADQDREVVEARLNSFVLRYLDYRFGHEPTGDKSMAVEQSTPQNDERLSSLESGLAEVSKTLGAITETLGSLAKSIEEDRKRNEELAARQDRAKRITALCAMMKLDSEKANSFIADEALSVEDVKDKLLAMKMEQSISAPADGESDKDSKAAKLAAEYEKHKDIHRKMGVRRDNYIKSQLDSDEEFELMTPEWAEEYREKFFAN